MIWNAVLLAYASLFALGLADNVRGPLYPDILKDFALDHSQGAWFFATSSLCGVLGGLATAAFTSRWDRLLTLALSCFLLGLGLVGMGAAEHFYFLLAAAAIFGFSLGLLGVLQNTLAAAGAPVEKRERVLSGLHACYGLASLTAPLLVNLTLGWFEHPRQAFYAAALIPFSVAAWIVLFRQKESAELKVRMSPESARQNEKKSKTYSLRQVWLAGVLSAYVMAEILVSSRLALFLRREKGEDLVSANHQVTLFFLFLLLGRLLAAFVKNPLPLKTQMFLSLLLSILCMGLGLGGWTWGFLLTGLAMAPFYPVAVAVMAQEEPEGLDRMVGVAISLQSLSVVLMHLIFGWTADRFGLQMAFWWGPAFLGLSFVLLWGYGAVFHRRSARL